jgi:arylsulfatase A-like enzyme/Flp pilus assembly protein TadD
MATWGCYSGKQGREDTPADLVLITIDTLRADALGFSGNRRSQTPLLDRLAATGRVFTNAYAHNVVTLPSHANILTGRYPYQHGVRDNSGFVLPQSVPTLAELLQEAGFATAAFVGAYPLDSRFGLDRGFEVYDDNYPQGSRPRVFLFAERSGEEVVETAMVWWRSHADRRRFLWLHLFEPHYPYAPQEPLASKFADHLYLGEVAAIDGQLEPLLGPLLEGDAERPAMVVFTSDHGEALGGHGEDTHGLFAYDETLKVPLVLWGPGIDTGVDTRLAGHIDLLPTVLEALAIPAAVADQHFPGSSLLARRGPPERAIYFEALTTSLNYGWAPLRGVVVGEMKYIELPLPELYDLSRDRKESENLLEDDPRKAGRYRSLLPAESEWPPRKEVPTIQEQAQLRGLGYLAARAPAKETYGPDDDPKNLVELDRKQQQMLALYTAGELEQAARLARDVLDRRPDTPVAYSLLAQVLLDQGRSDEAIEFMRRVQQRGRATPALKRQLALSLIEVGRPEEALLLLDSLLATPTGTALQPEDLVTLALALSAVERQEEAAQILQRALKMDPESPRTLEAAGLVALRRDSYGEAAAFAGRALQRNQDLPDAWNILGVALYSDGKEGALEAWIRSVELDASQYDALRNIWLVASELERLDLMKWALERFVESAPEERYEADIEEARQRLRTLQAGRSQP